MLRVVIDTNVVLSALLFGGKPRKVLEAAFEGNIQLYTSGVLLTELERVLGREKFGFSPRFIQNILVEITNISEWTETNQSMTIIKEDPTDTTGSTKYFTSPHSGRALLQSSFGLPAASVACFADTRVHC
jgi:putative PIN family toxin of toxin-antitoxin system